MGTLKVTALKIAKYLSGGFNQDDGNDLVLCYKTYCRTLKKELWCMFGCNEEDIDVSDRLLKIYESGLGDFYYYYEYGGIKNWSSLGAWLKSNYGSKELDSPDFDLGTFFDFRIKQHEKDEEDDLYIYGWIIEGEGDWDDIKHLM